MTQHLVTEIKQQVLDVLKYRYPQTYKHFRLKCRRWSTGGSIDVLWTDGSAEHEVSNHLASFKDATIISVLTERSYSYHFLHTVTLRYCEARGCAIPTVEGSDKAYIKHDTPDITIKWDIYKHAAQIDARDLEDIAFVKDENTVRMTSLTLKQDYGKGLHKDYAIIGRQGYALRSGPNVWFDIYEVAKRHGSQKVKIVPGTGHGYYFTSVEIATAALKQLVDTGHIQLLFTNGTWHY